MKFLLKLKHWQLFGITWGVPILINFFTITDPALSFMIFPIMMAFFSLGTYGWIWAIGTELQKWVPPQAELKITQFKIVFAIPLVYGAILLLGMSTSLFHSLAGQGTNFSSFEVFLIFLHLFSMACIFYAMLLAAKTLKTVELGRLARFSDYAGELFLIWFSIIGYWVLQPRLNRLVKGGNTSDKETFALLT